LLVAKTDLTHRRLTRMIERREVERVYAALAWGHFAKSPVDIEAPITRHPTDRKRMTVLAGGRHAVTHVRVTARFAQTDLLRVTLGTGRTHQIRVHLAHVGHPVVGGPGCAAEAERIRGIVPWFERTRIPGAPPVVAGVVNVRGTLVTVVEGWRALRQPEPAADGGGRGSGTTVLLEVGGGKKVLGF